MRFSTIPTRFLSAAVVLLSCVPVLAACPFCPAPRTTLSERVSRADAVILVQWVSAQRKVKQRPALTTFQVVHTAKNSAKAFKRNDRIVLGGYTPGQRGDLFLLIGRRQRDPQWDEPLEVTETSYQYVIQAPPPETRLRERLAYFLKFLEYPDKLIADDAFYEFAKAPFADIVPLADKLPRKRLRKWLAEPDFTNPRLGLYGVLLGLCGTDEDAQLLAGHITAPTKEFRLGVDGMIGGYLLLTGEKGLDLIDRKKLRDTTGPITEIFATMQALRFQWTYGSRTIGRERLKQSMRIVLDRPDLADIAITDLARWKDWSVQDLLMKRFDQKEYQSKHVQRAIISYMIASTRDVPKNAAKLPKHVTQGQKYIEALRKKDPKAVYYAERFFLPN